MTKYSSKLARHCGILPKVSKATILSGRLNTTLKKARLVSNGVAEYWWRK